MKYNDTETPNISNPNATYFNKATRKLNLTVTIAESELDLVGVKVVGYLNNYAINLTADVDLPNLNHITLVKTNLDNANQTLSNGVVVTIYP